MTPAQAPKSEDGVWVSRTAPRAVLVLTTRADGADLDGQQQALNAVRNAFVEQAQRPGANVEAEAALRLELSGAGSFGVAARERIKSEVERLAIWGGAIMVVLLWLAFASLRALAVALLPVATGVLAGIAAVSLGFGQVHGMTLGFGTTLIGEAVDYAIYYLIQARAPAGAAAPAHDESHATALAARELADGAARPPHLADRLRRARLRRLSRPRPARRVLGRRPARRGGDDALRLSGDRARRRAGRRPARRSSAG